MTDQHSHKITDVYGLRSALYSKADRKALQKLSGEVSQSSHHPAIGIDSSSIDITVTPDQVIRAEAKFGTTAGTVTEGGTTVLKTDYANDQDIQANINNALDAKSVPAGGSTGQVLRKVSSGNYDTGWITPDAGHPPVVVIDSTSIDLTIEDQVLRGVAKFGTTAGTVTEGGTTVLKADYTADKTAQGITNTYLENRIDSLDPVTNITKVATADVSTTVGYTTAFDLSVAVTSGDQWILEYTLFLTSPASSGLPLWILMGTGSTFRASIQGSGASKSAIKGDVLASTATSAPFVTYAGDGVVRVSVLLNAAATVNVNVGLEAVSGGTAYIRAGSYVTARKVA